MVANPPSRQNISAGTPADDSRGALPRTPRKASSDADRFIPSRSALDLDQAHFALVKENGGPATPRAGAHGSPSSGDVVSPSKEEYKKRLTESLLGGDSRAEGTRGNVAAKILAFKTKAPVSSSDGSGLRGESMYSSNLGPAPAKKAFRHIPQAPERILDAPELLDDYYLNLLDWSCNNTLAVALNGTVYLWNASTGDIQQLMQTRGEEDYVASVAWAADGKHIAVGTHNAEVQIWDAQRAKQLRTLRGHSARVGALAWNGHQLSSGGRDSLVINHDVRVRDSVQARLQSHDQEVCGLKWSPSGNQLASGGNDNMLYVWDQHSIGNGTHLHQLAEHKAAVKALAWCPFQSNLLASGGGTADRCIKFWNTHTGACLNSVDTNSQVCSLVWNKNEKEILSSHGFSQNQLCLWKYPGMVKMAELTGHTARVLHMAQSPDGSTVVSAAADETLRFWKVFGNNSLSSKKSQEPASGMMRSINIR